MKGAIDSVARLMGNGTNFMVACLTVKDWYANILLEDLIEACQAKGVK